MLAHNLADSTTKLQESRKDGVEKETELIRFSKMEEKIEEISDGENGKKKRRKKGKRQREQNEEN